MANHKQSNPGFGHFEKDKASSLSQPKVTGSGGADTAKAGSVIGGAVGVPVPLACAAFTAVIGGTCFATSATQMDRINSVLVALVGCHRQMILEVLVLMPREMHDAIRHLSISTALTLCCLPL